MGILRQLQLVPAIQRPRQAGRTPASRATPTAQGGTTALGILVERFALVFLGGSWIAVGTPMCSGGEPCRPVQVPDPTEEPRLATYPGPEVPTGVSPEASAEPVSIVFRDPCFGQLIRFAQGSDELPADADRVLTGVAATFQAFRDRGLQLVLEGHMDVSEYGEDRPDVGTPGLSLRRALVVRQSLLERGLPAASLAIEDYGVTCPRTESADGIPTAGGNRLVVVRLACLDGIPHTGPPCSLPGSPATVSEGQSTCRRHVAPASEGAISQGDVSAVAVDGSGKCDG